jgi:hypothetical protein
MSKKVQEGEYDIMDRNEKQKETNDIVSPELNQCTI